MMMYPPERYGKNLARDVTLGRVPIGEAIPIARVFETLVVLAHDLISEDERHFYADLFYDALWLRENFPHRADEFRFFYGMRGGGTFLLSPDLSRSTKSFEQMLNDDPYDPVLDPKWSHVYEVIVRRETVDDDEEEDVILCATRLWRDSGEFQVRIVRDADTLELAMSVEDEDEDEEEEE